MLVNANTGRQTAAQKPEPTPTTPSIVRAASTSPYFFSNFNAGEALNDRWQQNSTDLLTHEITPDGFYRLHNARPGTAETSIYQSDATFNGVSIEMLGRLEASSQPNSAYGIAFHYHDENNYNVFAVDGMGRYSIWVRSNGEWIELRDADSQWTPNDIIQPVGKSNMLTLTVSGRLISGYVNGREVTRVTDTMLDDGRIGVYFATDDGEATVLIDSYRVYSTVPSMTGDH